MLEDKLTRDERIRLEALAQANASYGMKVENAMDEDIIDTAKVFEKYIRGEEEE